MKDLHLKQYIKKATIKEVNYAVVIWVGFETGVTFYCNNFFLTAVVFSYSFNSE